MNNKGVSLYDKEKEKIYKKYYINGKLIGKGIWELYILNKRFGKEVMPSDYGTKEFYRNR